MTGSAGPAESRPGDRAEDAGGGRLESRVGGSCPAGPGRPGTLSLTAGIGRHPSPAPAGCRALQPESWHGAAGPRVAVQATRATRNPSRARVILRLHRAQRCWRHDALASCTALLAPRRACIVHSVAGASGAANYRIHGDGCRLFWRSRIRVNP